MGILSRLYFQRRLGDSEAADEAVANTRLVAIVLFACIGLVGLGATQLWDRVLFWQANNFLQSKNDFHAYLAFEKLVKTYPKSRLCEPARQNMETLLRNNPGLRTAINESRGIREEKKPPEDSEPILPLPGQGPTRKGSASSPPRPPAGGR